MGNVLILGGGLAGTSAALLLADRGISATIVEARGRLGGRALSRPLPGDAGPPVEYGGGWGHAGQPRIQVLAARLGLALTQRAPLINHRYLRDGALHDTPCTAAEAPAHDAAMAQWQADAAASDPAILAMTLADYFTHRAMPQSARREILSWWSISGSTDPALGCTGQLLTPKLAQGFAPKVAELGFTIAGGVQAMAEGAARLSGAQVVLSDPAERLTHTDAGVTLRLASGRTLSARAAIVALPINALDQLRLDPPLPPGPAQLRRSGHIGRAVKLLITARGVAPGQLVTGNAQGLRFFWSDHIRPDGSTLIVAFALAADLPDPSEAIARAALAQAFPGAQFLSCDWHDWLSDPFSRGTWVGPRAQDEAAFEARMWPPYGALAFAGSDIAPAEQGWFEGALASAEAAASAVTDMIRKAPP